MEPENVKQELSISCDELQKATKSMKVFSLSTRALFLENTTLTSSSTAEMFEKLRDDTRNVAVAYAKGGLPLVKKCVSDIKGYFEYYEDLTKDEWWDNIAIIVKEVKAHKEACNALVEVHEHFLCEVKKLKDSATMLMKERKDLAAEYENEASKLRMTALGKGALGLALLLIPQLSAPAALAMGTGAMSSVMACMDQGSKEDKKASAEIAIVAVIRDNVVPALSEFISALTCLSRLFAVLQEELETLQGKGEKAMEGEEPKDIHYKVMKKKAGRIMNYCNDLIKELPSIRSDLSAIPTKGLDDHYVEGLLLMVKESVSKHCANTEMLNTLMKTVPNGNKKQVTVHSMDKIWNLLDTFASFWGVSPHKLLAFIVCLFIVLFACFPKALLMLLLFAVLAYFAFF